MVYIRFNIAFIHLVEASFQIDLNGMLPLSAIANCDFMFILLALFYAALLFPYLFVYCFLQSLFILFFSQSIDDLRDTVQIKEYGIGVGRKSIRANAYATVLIWLALSALPAIIVSLTM